MFQAIIFTILLTTSLFAGITPYNLIAKPIKENREIRILDAKKMDFDGVHELSALAYKKGSLYALSDQGILYLFSLDIQDNKIHLLSLKAKYILQNKKSQALKKKKRDAEGLCFYKDGFLISFEGKNRVFYASLKGKKIKKMKLNPLLEDKKNYQSSNKGLESVAYSKKYGLITIPEKPLNGSDQHYHSIYAKGQVWKFKAEGSVTDIILRDKERLIVLLRKYSYLTQHRRTTLVEVNLNQCNKQNVCKSKVLADLDSSDGWKIDNFEGLAKIDKNRFLMVSDDNESFFQKTLLVLFEIKN